MMPRLLRGLFLVTDLGFVTYWTVSALMLAGIELLSPAAMFKNYDDPVIQAWNWSFMPLDLILSGMGLYAVARARAGRDWQRPALVSLAMTHVAGLMAVAFWAIRGDFDPSWWAMNLFLMIWPVPFVITLVRADS